MDHLSRQQTSFCDNAGLAGILIGLCCLIQHLFFLLLNWITVSIIIVYILSLVSFFLLARKSPHAPVLLLITAILLFFQEGFMVYEGVFSAVLLLYLIYVIVITVLILTSSLPKKLKLHAAQIKEESAEWNGKI